MRRLFPVVLVVAAACSQAGPSPTMDLNEIGTAVANTLVAEAIETIGPSNTPEPSNTPQPTDTRRPNPTATPWPTSTPRPPTATPRPPAATQDPGCPFGCTFQKAGCNIKGNISFNSGEKIYHVPGQQYYNATKISPDFGERWFCTEREALNNGWRKAKV